MTQQDKPDYADCCNRWPDCKHDEGQQDSDELRKLLAPYVGCDGNHTFPEFMCFQGNRYRELAPKLQNLIEQERLRAQLLVLQELWDSGAEHGIDSRICDLQDRLDKLTEGDASQGGER